MRSLYRPHARVQKATIGPTLTKASHSKECDINNIMKRFNKTGLVDHLNAAQGVYADVSDIGSYQEALETVEAAKGIFLSLPSEARAAFDNDPAAYLDWQANATDAEREAFVGALTSKDRLGVDNPPSESPKPVSEPVDGSDELF